MKMQGGDFSFIKWVLFVVVSVQLVACGSGSKIIAGTAPIITSANNATFVAGAAGTFTVTATGIPAPTLVLTGSLPTGVTFDASTGILSGTTTSIGVFPLTITASNGFSPIATQNFTLVVVSTTVLIVEDGTEADVVANLTTKLKTAGYTPVTNVNVPAGSLSGYRQIWDVRFQTQLIASDVTSYTAYLAGGGTLFMIGEDITNFSARDNTIAALIGSLGGGTITPLTTPNNPQTVLAPFNGPTPITTITFNAAAGTTNPGTGAFITKDAGNIGAALIYNRGTLSGAPGGRLLVVFDADFLGSAAGPNLQSFTANLIANTP